MLKNIHIDQQKGPNPPHLCLSMIRQGALRVLPDGYSTVQAS